MKNLPWNSTEECLTNGNYLGVKNNYHEIPMLSLQNAYTLSDLTKFFSSIRHTLGIKINTPLEFCVEPKLDGLAISVIYHQGKFAYGLTRGDGHVGEDVTEALQHVNFPKTLPEINGKFYPLVEIRGEIFLPISKLEELNLRRKQGDLPTYKTTRNTAVGLLKQKTPKPEELNLLSFRGYDLPTPEVKNTFYTQIQLLKTLKSLGFDIAEPYFECTEDKCYGLLVNELEKKRYTFDFPIDGAVLKLNSLELQMRMGEASKYPKWAKAWKFPASEGITTVLSVTWNMGKTGYFTPVAELFPVMIDGVTISRATLHNVSYIKRKGVKINSRVVLERRGDVIPAITGVLVTKDTEDLKEIKLPTHCPSCNSDLLVMRSDTGVEKLFCPNGEKCPQQVVHALYEREILKGGGRGKRILGVGFEAFEELYYSGVLAKMNNDFKNIKSHLDEIRKLSKWKKGRINTVLKQL